MWRVAVLTLIVFSFSILGLAQPLELENQEILLKAGSHMSEFVPLVLPLSAEVAKKSYEVLEPKTGNTFPVTIRNNEFVFVSEGAMPGTEHRYVVTKKDREVPEKVQIVKRESEQVLDVVIDDELFTSYHYQKTNKKPFLWPLNTVEEIGVTRDWPMGEKMTTQDHPHQKSCWSAYGDINGTDCWTEGDKSGFQEVQDVSFGSGDAYGWIVSKNIWLSNQKEPVLNENREYRFYATPAKMRIFDLVLTFDAAYGDVLFKDTKEGGLIAVRMRDDLTEKFGKGVITLADGKTGMAQAWGKPSPWCDYSGPIEGLGTVGIALFDHPTNLRHPTRWHVRDYGLMGANCFGLSAFTANDPEPKNGDFTLKKGEQITFRYRIYVHTGDVQAARVAEKYADFATPPHVEWIKK